MAHIEMKVGGNPADAELSVDGHDALKLLAVRSINLQVSAFDRPKISIDTTLRRTDRLALANEGTVELSGELVEMLTGLGWTPPGTVG